MPQMVRASNNGGSSWFMHQLKQSQLISLNICSFLLLSPAVASLPVLMAWPFPNPLYFYSHQLSNASLFRILILQEHCRADHHLYEHMSSWEALVRPRRINIDTLLNQGPSSSIPSGIINQILNFHLATARPIRGSTILFSIAILYFRLAPLHSLIAKLWLRNVDSGSQSIIPLRTTSTVVTIITTRRSSNRHTEA